MVTLEETREYLTERDVLPLLSLFHDHKAPTIVTHAEAAAAAPAAKQEESLDIRTSYLQRHELDAAHLQPLFALPDGVALVLGFVSPDLSLDDVATSIKHELPSDAKRESSATQRKRRSISPPRKTAQLFCSNHFRSA